MKRKSRKMNKYERAVEHALKLKTAYAGEGLFVFKNNNAKGDLHLPKPAADGRRIIPSGGEFQGDSYFMNLVQTHELRLVRTVTPVPERITMSETKLIVDQPDRVTTEGTIEQVAKTQPVVQKLNEGMPKPSVKTNEDVLLTGDVLDGVEILG